MLVFEKSMKFQVNLMEGKESNEGQIEVHGTV